MSKKCEAAIRVPALDWVPNNIALIYFFFSHTCGVKKKISYPWLTNMSENVYNNIMMMSLICNQTKTRHMVTLKSSFFAKYVSHALIFANVFLFSPSVFFVIKQNLLSHTKFGQWLLWVEENVTVVYVTLVDFMYWIFSMTCKIDSISDDTALRHLVCSPN
jgi:hypothetical protein